MNKKDLNLYQPVVLLVCMLLSLPTLMFAQAGIVIDAQKDAFYETLTGPDDGYLQIKSYAFNDNGIPRSDADLSAKVWAAWDNDWFYLYEEVMDDSISGDGTTNYGCDALELKFDPQATDAKLNSVLGLNITALGKKDPGVVTADSLTPVPDSLKQYARAIIPGGYALEMAIKWSAITSTTTADTENVAVALDSVFGLAICNHDNDSKTARQASIAWGAVQLDAVWNTPKYLGTVKFLPDHKLQFIPSNHMTGVTNPVPYDGTPFYLSIDGKKDPFYTQLTGPDNGYLQLRYFAHSDNGMPEGDADLSAKIWTAWDNDWFYLYEEVKDDTVAAAAANVWEEDEIELKIDPQPTDSTQTTNFETRLTPLGMKTKGVVAEDTLGGIPDSLRQWFRKTAKGSYTLEFAINWKAIKNGKETITPAVDNVFGLAINQHDNDKHPNRTASLMWAAVLLDAAWKNPKYLGTAKFAADNHLQLIPTNNMTGKTNPIPYDGTFPAAVEKQPAVVNQFSLSQNYPNPFNPTTMINYSISATSNVRLTVYDILGKEVATLVTGKKTAGEYQVAFDGTNLSSGIYFYKLQCGNNTKTQKMMMLK